MAHADGDEPGILNMKSSLADTTCIIEGLDNALDVGELNRHFVGYKSFQPVTFTHCPDALKRVLVTAHYDDDVYGYMQYTGTAKGVELTFIDGGSDGTTDHNWFNGFAASLDVVNHSAAIVPRLWFVLDRVSEIGDFNAVVSLSVDYE